MTDKEKIELIIQDKHLNNTEFCNEVCISPGTLSHIRSGRTEPTLNILRSIVQAFPDINPAWLYYGEGSMYRNQDSPTSEQEDAAATSHINNEEDAGESQMNLFRFSEQAVSSSKSYVGTLEAAPQNVASRRSPTSPSAVPSSLSVQEIVAETLKQQQRPQRKVVEVRIFFDDGTFETFSAK